MDINRTWTFFLRVVPCNQGLFLSHDAPVQQFEPAWSLVWWFSRMIRKRKLMVGWDSWLVDGWLMVGTGRTYDHLRIGFGKYPASEHQLYLFDLNPPQANTWSHSSCFNRCFLPWFSGPFGARCQVQEPWKCRPRISSGSTQSQSNQVRTTRQTMSGSGYHTSIFNHVTE